MDAKFKSQTRLQNIIFLYLQPSWPRLATKKFEKGAYESEKDIFLKQQFSQGIKKHRILC
jgi:hypothetical protein